MLADVATNPYAPPQFRTSQLSTRNVAVGETPLARYDNDYADLLIASYPKVGSRRYDAGAERVLVAVRELMTKRSWNVVDIRGLPPVTEAVDPPAPQADEKDGKPDKKADAGNKESPAETQLPEDDAAPLNIEIEAVAWTLVMRFEHDIAINVISEAEATLVDMRSASRAGRHDFGGNARIIERFLADLDAALLGVAGEG
jgi:hypothetical protein